MLLHCQESCLPDMEHMSQSCVNYFYLLNDKRQFTVNWYLGVKYSKYRLSSLKENVTQLQLDRMTCLYCYSCVLKETGTEDPILLLQYYLAPWHHSWWC